MLPSTPTAALNVHPRRSAEEDDSGSVGSQDLRELMSTDDEGGVDDEGELDGDAEAAKGAAASSDEEETVDDDSAKGSEA
jgi:hypothetical protein